MIEEARLKKEEEERLAIEELNRLAEEETKLQPWKRQYEEKLSNSLSAMNEDEEWNRYSFCEDRYINVRREKDLNGFVYEFKERCDLTFIANFKLIEKNLQEEMFLFDHSQLHYLNLTRLLIEAKATRDLKKLEYSYHYLQVLQDLEKKKIEALTIYFVENFEYCKKVITEELYRKNKEREEEVELNVEYADEKNDIKMGFWINSSDGKFRETYTKFKNLNIQLLGIPKAIVMEENIIRFFWTSNDIREWQRKEYCPYISISGVYYVDKILHPKKSLQVRKWEMRETIGNKYINKDPMASTIRFNYQIELPKNVYVKDLTSVVIGKYCEETGKWLLDGIEHPEFDNEKKLVTFHVNELAIYSILLERSIFFPYKSWYLRCVNKTTAVLDLVTPRLTFVFEIGITLSKTNKINSEPLYVGYVKLINNAEPEFSHLVDKEFRYDEMILELRNCGILLTPDEEDLSRQGVKLKKYDSSDRALNDIIMACRQYAIRSHDLNLHISEDIVLAKFKPNLEYDFKFFDDEEKDWFEVGWYFNKATMGNTFKEEGEIKFQPTTATTRPHFHLLVKDMNQDDIYDVISEVNSPFLVNLKNFLTILNITNIP